MRPDHSGHSEQVMRLDHSDHSKQVMRLDHSDHSKQVMRLDHYDHSKQVMRLDTARLNYTRMNTSKLHSCHSDELTDGLCTLDITIRIRRID